MKLSRDGRFLSILIGIAMPTALLAQVTTKEAVPPAISSPDTAPPASWTSLFDGRTLAGWKPTNFGGEGEVSVQDGTLLLDFGSAMTGVTHTGAFPQNQYEIRFEAMRVDGRDFFCGLTFPVDSSFCSLIVGGWAGALVGLSSIDGKDASENETTKFIKFENGKWYRFRLRVTPQRIQTWMNDELIIDQGIQGRQLSIRPEVNLSRPLGFATWETKGALRKIEYRRLDAAPTKAGSDKSD